MMMTLTDTRRRIACWPLGVFAAFVLGMAAGLALRVLPW